MILPLKTLIIDDEELARKRLLRLLAPYYSYITIIGEATNGDEAFEMIESLKPDLVFLDIQMPGKEVFQMLKELKHQPFVIFCTAYDHFALKAFDSLSIDYILKPVEEERIHLSIEKLKNISEHQKPYSQLDELRQVQSRTISSSIPYKIGDKVILIKLDDITHFVADNKYTNFFNVEGKSFLITKTLKMLDELLPENFIRISKSAIINKNHIKEIHLFFRNKYVFCITDVNKTKLISGSIYKENIKKLIEF